MIYGARVAFWNVGKGAKLLTETSQMGVNAQNVKNIARDYIHNQFGYFFPLILSRAILM